MSSDLYPNGFTAGTGAVYSLWSCGDRGVCFGDWNPADIGWACGDGEGKGLLWRYGGKRCRIRARDEEEDVDLGTGMSRVSVFFWYSDWWNRSRVC
ncbi:hypothetical protein DY000_02025948 [Brassica cretica]|uniref:Uncharacterized protein n=1 Tax=Brassica cretica TaxID=69181 RepID=A0ABQ7EGX8_BRACR|nr:hypothetical protein DY000_02025948 [Brassica cretica]